MYRPFWYNINAEGKNKTPAVSSISRLFWYTCSCSRLSNLPGTVTEWYITLSDKDCWKMACLFWPEGHTRVYTCWGASEMEKKEAYTGKLICLDWIKAKVFFFSVIAFASIFKTGQNTDRARDQKHLLSVLIINSYVQIKCVFFSFF